MSGAWTQQPNQHHGENRLDVHGLTITNTDKRYEESELVELVRKELKINHNASWFGDKRLLASPSRVDSVS